MTNNNGIAGGSGFEVLMGRFVKRGDPGLKDEYVTPTFDVVDPSPSGIFNCNGINQWLHGDTFHYILRRRN